MRAIRDLISKFANALAAERDASRYVCASCEMHDRCSLPPSRRRLCWEVRAMWPR